ncbi:MAG: rhodanese-like domain-containing protein [Woeseiaceae bacterium]
MRPLPQPGRQFWRVRQNLTHAISKTMDQILEFTSNNLILVVLLMISFFVLIFSELRRKASGMVAVEPSDAVTLMNSNGVVVDLRNSEAFARGHIVNAKNVPYDELDAQQAKLEQYKSKPVIAVCDAGMTSTRAVAALRNAGFDSAYTLKGGMNAWSQAGMPVVSGKKTKSKK